MEDIFPLLAVAIIYAVTYVLKKSFSNGDQELGEAFPPIEVFGSGEEADVPDAGDSAVSSDTGRVATSSHQHSTATDRGFILHPFSEILPHGRFQHAAS